MQQHSHGFACLSVFILLQIPIHLQGCCYTCVKALLWSHKLSWQIPGSGSSLFHSLFLQDHMHCCMHVCAFYQHPNGHVHLSVCIHQPVVIGFHSQAACLLWINTPKPHVDALKHQASRHHTWGQWRLEAQNGNHKHSLTHGLVLLSQASSPKPNI